MEIGQEIANVSGKKGDSYGEIKKIGYRQWDIFIEVIEDRKWKIRDGRYRLGDRRWNRVWKIENGRYRI